MGGVRHHNAPTHSIGAHLVKHWTTYPLVTHPYNPEFVSGPNGSISNWICCSRCERKRDATC